MTFKVIQDPKTGKMKTVDDLPTATPESLAKQHKELRDMLDGNTQFHVDPLAKPPDKPASVIPDAQDEDDNPYQWVVF